MTNDSTLAAALITSWNSYRLNINPRCFAQGSLCRDAPVRLHPQLYPAGYYVIHLIWFRSPVLNPILVAAPLHLRGSARLVRRVIFCVNGRLSRRVDNSFSKGKLYRSRASSAYVLLYFRRGMEEEELFLEYIHTPIHSMWAVMQCLTAKYLGVVQIVLQLTLD